MNTSNTGEGRVERILVVGEMSSDLFLMNGLFEDRYDIVQVNSGEEAMKVVMSARAPDMVLLDVMPADMDGHELMRRIRQHPPATSIPIVFLASLADQQDGRFATNLATLDDLDPADSELVLLQFEESVHATAEADRLEQLRDKLVRHLSPESWRHLFHGPGSATISFRATRQTILYADAPGVEAMNEHERDSLAADIESLAARHRGEVDRFHEGAGVVFFDDPAACVRMAMDLQRGATHRHLRMGVHTGICEIGTFRRGMDWRRTLIGPETGLAAKVAATAAIGSIAVSPETYALVKDEINSDATACLLMEEFEESDLAQVSLTPTPTRQGRLDADALSTFAGLGA